VVCWAIILLQSGFILYTKYPAFLDRVGLYGVADTLFGNSGFIKHDRLWELSRERDRTGLIRALGDIDEYSTYLNEDQYESFAIDTQQEYEGIGVSLLSTTAGAQVRNVFPNGPASRAGIQKGDTITHINGYDVRNWTFESTINELRGSSGTPLHLKLRRGSENYEAMLRRGAIDIPSIQNVRVTDEGVLYLKIEQFGEKTAHEFIRHLSQNFDDTVIGLVIDLRENTGGTFRTSLNLIDPFYERGDVMLRTKSTSYNRTKTFKSRRKGILDGFPTVVLVNRNTASASEIVAGSLQATGKAVVVGEKTMGKGSIQSVYQLDNGDAYKKTTSHYYLPDGSPVNKIGIRPDVEIRLSQYEYINYLKRENSSIAPYATPNDPYWEAALDILLHSKKDSLADR
jgi:carboxyl-terminal processing protease